MFGGLVSNCVFLTDLFKTAIFRISFMALLAMAGVLVAQFWLIYTHVESVEADRLTKILTEDADTLSHMPLERLKYVVNNHIVDDLHIFVSHIEVFTSDRKPIMGNIPTWPQGLETDGKLHFVKMRFQNGRQYFLHVLAVPLSNGHVLVIGCGLRFLIEQKITLQRAMLVSVVPVFFIALLLSIALGYRALSRIKEMNIAIKKIMGGDIHERLPVRAKQYDGVEQLANSVNHMLDKLEHLVEDIREVGNNIAHDLRTPLSRLRSRLERALVMVESEDSCKASYEVISQAIGDLDQSLAVITALLRITELENSCRKEGFSLVHLGEIINDVYDLYEPIAEMENKQLLKHFAEEDIRVLGDKHLLIEMLANLVDNAIKFTPEGGSITLSMKSMREQVILTVTDTGIGIAPEERQSVLSRFYRSDKSRHVSGCGLGLSLVKAIISLHEIEMSINSGPNGIGTCFCLVFHKVCENLEFCKAKVIAS